MITGSGAAYLPGSSGTGVLVEQGGGLPLRRDPRERAARSHPGLRLQPGPRPDRHDQRLRRRHAVDAARARAALVHVLASGRADALAGRYIHAEHDDIEDLIARADEIEGKDLNAIRLQRLVFAQIVSSEAKTYDGSRWPRSTRPSATSTGTASGSSPGWRRRATGRRHRPLPRARDHRLSAGRPAPAPELRARGGALARRGRQGGARRHRRARRAFPTSTATSTTPAPSAPAAR